MRQSADFRFELRAPKSLHLLESFTNVAIMSLDREDILGMVCHKAILPAKCRWKIELAGKIRKLPARMADNKICKF